MKKRHLKVFLTFVLMLAVTLSLLPLSALATEESEYYARSLDGGTLYSSIDSAWAAANNGTAIVMLRDWSRSEKYEIGEGKRVTIYMNGFTINRNLDDDCINGEVIYMNDNSYLYLMGYDSSKNIVKKELNFNGYTIAGQDKKSVTLTSGGLVTGGMSCNGAGGIHMKENTHLTLDNVTIGGNGAYSSVLDDGGFGGGVMLDGKGTIVMDNGAFIAYNYAAYRGGGIYVEDSGCIVSLDHSSTIYHNISSIYGGGVCCNDDGFTLNLNGNSSIKDNDAQGPGGGFYSTDTDNNIISADGTGQISYNTSGSGRDGGNGGGICLNDADIWTTDKNHIKGITLIGNRSCEEAGAMYLGQENTVVEDCIIKDNQSAHWTGGVDAVNDNITLRNCTITGNTAELYAGGVFVTIYNDIKLEGKVIIKGNTLADGSPSDLWVSDYWTSTAYIISQPDAGSEIGIHTNANKEDRKIGKNTSFDSSVFFSDAAGYTVEATSDNELWLRYNNNSYFVTVNGKLQGYYAQGAKLTINDDAADSTKVFKQWTGDDQALGCLDDITKANAAITSMPAANLSYTSGYFAKISDVTLTVEKPVAGKTLATTGTLHWTDENGNTETAEVDVYWLEQTDDGTTQTVSGTADYATKYSVAAKIDPDASKGLVFADDITGTVKYTATAEKAHTARVDENGSLYLYGNQIETEKAEIESVEEANISIIKDSSEEELKAALPATAVVYYNNWTPYIVNVDKESADLSTILTDEGKITEDGVVTIQLSLEETDKVVNGTGDNEKKLTVNVTVIDNGKLNVPTADPAPGTYSDKADGTVTKTVTLAADEGATIYYRILGSETEGYNTYDPSTGIVISAGAGQKKVFNILTYADGIDGYAKSDSAIYRYTLDNPFTVTITKMCGETEIGDKAYAAEYYYGETVNIGAPVVSGCTFESWADESGITIEEADRNSDILPSFTIENDITLTALYVEEEAPDVDPPVHPRYYYTIKYVLKDSDPLVELGSRDSLAESGMDVSNEAEETLTDEDGNTYNRVSVGECIVTEDETQNIFYAYYEKQEEEPQDDPSGDSDTPQDDPSGDSDTPQDDPSGDSDTPQEDPASNSDVPHAKDTASDSDAPQARNTISVLSPQTGDTTENFALVMALSLIVLLGTVVIKNRTGTRQ